MLDWMFIILFIFALLLLSYLIFESRTLSDFWLLSLIIFDAVLWWTLALVNTEIEIPYTMYNASSGNIETGYYMYHSLISPTLIYVFSAPAILLTIFLIYQLVVIIRKTFKK